MKTLPKPDQETIVLWNPEDQIATVDTSMPGIIRKLDALVAKYPDSYRCVFVDGQYRAKRYSVPAAFIRFDKPPSQAKRAASKKNMMQINEALGA